MEITLTPIFAIAGQKFSRSFEVYLYVLFALFQNSYVFIPLFLAEPLTVFCRTLFEKHCPILSNIHKKKRNTHIDISTVVVLYNTIFGNQLNLKQFRRVSQHTFGITVPR